MNWFMKIRLMHVAMLIASCGASLAAQSYIVVDNQTGFILSSKSRDEKLQVASLTKVATAAVVLDWAQLTKADLSQMVSITAASLRAGGTNSVGLMEGDSVSLRDLLYCALMASDNVAATALAQHVGERLPNTQRLDPISNFVSHMNALAHTLGMKRTLFLNPSGNDSIPDSALPYSTASDIARLTRYAYSEADFPYYVSQVTRGIHVVRGGASMPVELKNTNELLEQEGIDGVKTGRTSRAGDCLILSAEKKPEVQRQGETVYVTPRRIIVVLLGSRDRFGEGSGLIRQGWSRYDGWAVSGRKLKSGNTL